LAFRSTVLLDPNWSYSIGVPRWDLKYHSPNKKSVLQTALFLDGYFVNIQNDIFLSSNFSAATVSLSALVAAAGYQYKITNEISVYGLVGHSLIQRHQLRDGNREKLEFSRNRFFSISIGIAS